MWLMTKHGFFSIVQKGKPGEYQIRARERHDLENLITGDGPLRTVKIIETPNADYHYRLIVSQIQLIGVLIWLGNTLDYSNFKEGIHNTPDQKNKNKPYAEVWRVLANALGAYSRPTKLYQDNFFFDESEIR